MTSDVIIVGAGPAGAATAILLAERGLSVRRSYSRDELRVLAARAGARRLTIRQYPVLGRLLAVLS